MNSYNRQSRPAGNSRGRSRKKQKQQGGAALIAGVAVVIVLTALIIIVNLRKPENAAETAVSSVSGREILPQTEETDSLKKNVEIDLSGVPGLKKDSLTLTAGMNRTEALKALKELYDWRVTAENSSAETGSIVKPTVAADETTAVGTGDEGTAAAEETAEVAALTEILVKNSLEMPDFIETRILELLDRIYLADRNGSDPEEISIYSLTLDGLDAAVEDFAQDCNDMWYVEARGGSIESYDPEKDEFLMEGSSDGMRVDQEQLKTDLSEQLKAGRYSVTVPVKTETISASSSVLNGEYTVIAEYVTKTTSNSVRNRNIRLACEQLNGTIVRPGEEFSYNYTVGERTAEKGYGAAAAYNNGEVVQEIGGGVCQVSSTLYNAVTIAGLKTTYRSSHTFKPTYITPGQDATVSWNGPDYRFANVIAFPDISYETTYAVGIRAKYEDQTVTVSLYGRPVLKPGYEVSMESEMTGETEMVRETIPEGSDKEPTTGDKGSSWKTWLLIQKDGELLSREVYHSTRYKGHTEYYYETLPETETESSTAQESETPDPDIMKYGPGYVKPSEENSEAAGPAGPVMETSAETASETAAESSAAQSSASGSGSGGAQISDRPGLLPEETGGSGYTPDSPGIIEDGP